MPEPKEQRVEAVERALSILDVFSDQAVRLTLNDLSQKTGYYPSTILRLTASLQRFGYMQRDSDGRFRLGASLFRLGTTYQRSFNLSDHVRPILAELADATQETSAFYVREGNTRICLFRHHPDRVFRHYLEEGAVLPLNSGATARVLVAYTDGEGQFYEDIRDRGYYISLGERDPETSAIGVPVFGVDQALVGSLGVTLPLTRLTPDVQNSILDLLKKAARKLSSSLGARG